MGFSTIEIVRLAGWGQIPNVLITNWSNYRGDNPLLEALHLEKTIIRGIARSVWLTSLIVGLFPTTYYFGSSMLPALTGILIGSLVIAFFLLCMFVPDILRVHKERKEYAEVVGKFGKDYFDLCTLFFGDDVGKFFSGVTKLNLKSATKKALIKKADARKREEKISRSGIICNNPEKALEEFRVAFLLALRFGLVDKAAGWTPFFEAKLVTHKKKTVRRKIAQVA